MAQCPTCHNEVKPGERFCGNCGARLDQQGPSAEEAPPTERLADGPPERPRTGKETVVLSALTDPDLRSPVAPPTGTPPADSTIIAGPPADPPHMAEAPASPGAALPPSRPPIDPTIIGLPPAGLPNQTAPPGGPAIGGAGTVPPAPATPPAQKSGGTIWKVLAIVAGIAMLACIAAGAGIWFLTRQLGTATENAFATVNAGLEDGSIATAFANIATSVAEPTAAGLASDVGGTAEGTVLFSDEFESADSSSFTADETENATYAFAGGGFEMTVRQPNLIVWKPIRGEYGDAAVAVDTTIDPGTQAASGLLFHFQDSNNFYIFTITHDGRYGLDLYTDQSEDPTILIDWTESSAIHPPGEVNSLRVETAGDRIRLYANDELLDEVSDGTFRRGKTALVVNSFDEAGASATFDNLVIRQASGE